MSENVADLKIDDAELQRALSAFGDAATDGRIPLSRFYSDWSATERIAWSRVTAAGGNFRGDSWPKFADQYTRSDGTVVPAWGGTAKANGHGTVKGRLRGSSKSARVTKQSVANIDTGELRDNVLTQRPDVTKERLRVGLPAVGDMAIRAKHLFIDLKRNPIKWFPGDGDKLTKHARQYFDTLARRFNR